MCTFAGITSEENNSRLWASISTLGLFLFVRHYLRFPIWFQILHLLICLNSAGCFAWCHVHVVPHTGSFTATQETSPIRIAVTEFNVTIMEDCCTIDMFPSETISRQT
jgi:hypothetical protein